MMYIYIFVILYMLYLYNTIVTLKNRVYRSKSSIDVYLNKRFDLIPNLVECVKAYTKYEESVYEKMLEIQKEYNQNKTLIQAKCSIEEMNKIINIIETFPESKASEQFLKLQKNLTKVESELQAARRMYNIDVTKYNTKLHTFPANFLCGSFFKEAELFEME